MSSTKTSRLVTAETGIITVTEVAVGIGRVGTEVEAGIISAIVREAVTGAVNVVVGAIVAVSEVATAVEVAVVTGTGVAVETETEVAAVTVIAVGVVTEIGGEAETGAGAVIATEETRDVIATDETTENVRVGGTQSHLVTKMPNRPALHRCQLTAIHSSCQQPSPREWLQQMFRIC